MSEGQPQADAPLRVMVVDDESMAVERMQLLLARIPGVNLVGTASDGEAALRLLRALPADLVLLDISMPGLDGIQVAEALAEQSAPPLIVFVTAFDRYAVRAFDVAAADYLLKPVDPARLERALARVRTLRHAAPEQPPLSGSSPYATEFWVPHRSEIVRIDALDIDFIEAERDYMRLHVGDRSFLLHQTIKELERRLDPETFVRTHRSYIFRRGAIERLIHEGLGVWSVETADGRQFRVGRTYLPAVKKMVSG